MKQINRREGFTLVELAIVLVIIGLLVGGILVGQDLIKAATIRSTVGDIEKTNAAATTFRTKYGGIPGDLMASKANEYGLNTGSANTTGRDGTNGRGDGNGLVEGCSANAVTLGCESAYFWVDLSAAALIPQRLATYAGATTFIADQTTSNGMANFLPKQKLRDNAFLHAFPTTGKNYYYLGGATASTSGVITLGNAVTGGEARSIDEKFDDALPTSGIVNSITALGTVDAGATHTASTCMNGTATPKVYNVVDANINNVNCMLQIRANF